MSDYRYTIISFNFDNYEVIREIKNPLPDVEYVYVTNDKEAKSDTWKIVVDPFYDTIENSFDKVVEFRHRVLNYCNTDICCRIDGSIAIEGSAFDKTIDEFNQRGDDIAFIIHPWFNTVRKELISWATLRNVPEEEIDRVVNYFTEHDYDVDYDHVYTLGMLIQRNNELSRDINEKQYQVMCDLKNYCNFEHFFRCDQAVFTYTIDKFFNDIKVLPLHYTILERLGRSMIYFHKSTRQPLVNRYASFEIFYHLFGQEISNVFNGDVWVGLLTNKDILEKGIKILLKASDDVFRDLNFKKYRLPGNKESYKDWLADENVITLGSNNFDDFQINDPNNSHHYTIDWYYKKLLPIIINELGIPYKEEDFVEIYKNHIYCKIPKEIQQLEVHCPEFERNKDGGYVSVFYSLDCLHAETSMTAFHSNKLHEQKVFPIVNDEYHNIFKYCHLPVKIVNFNCTDRDKTLLLIGNSHTIPFVPILSRYFYKVIVLDNRLENFTYDFLFAYENISNILLLGSYEKNKNDLLDVTRFK